MMEKLKPCPFCGETPIINHVSESHIIFDVFTMYWVVCPKCGVRTQKHTNINEVIKVWNRREGERDA